MSCPKYGRDLYQGTHILETLNADLELLNSPLKGTSDTRQDAVELLRQATGHAVLEVGSVLGLGRSKGLYSQGPPNLPRQLKHGE